MTMTLTINPDDWKKVLAEVVGTFFFFFIGIGSIPISQSMPSDVLLPMSLFLVALAHGLALSLAISALGHISGGHFNPAVTIGLAVGRKISPALALFYIIGQIAGGVAACLTLTLVLPQQAWRAINLGTPAFNTTLIDGNQATLLEAVLTFFLVLAVFGTAVDPRGPKIGGFGIGLVVFVDILVGGVLTGGVMNPARALSPAIVSGVWADDQFVYAIGPIVGGIVAALLYSFVFLPKETDQLVVAPKLSDQTIDPPLSEPNLVDDVAVVREAGTQTERM